MGDNFKPKDSNQVFNVIITQSMEKILGNGSAIGKTMQLPGSKENEYYNLSVTGVVNDYVYGDMYGKSSPVIFYCIPQATTLMYVRTKPSDKPEQLLAKMETVMKKDNPAFPFEYKFVDDQFNGMFMSEMLISKLSQVFASLAILISCLGLFGLAAYTAERRTKEIGVRKVLGASASGLAGLLSKDFLKLVGFSCLVAFPVAWFVMNDWLKQYAYRISIHWQIFFIAGVAAMLIAAATVSFQAVKAALMNPIKSLKAE
jgi:ABC-type antimicrobial peptide transport system permease subunit